MNTAPVIATPIETLRARRAAAHAAFYGARSGPDDGYERGLQWGILSTLDYVLGVLDPTHTAAGKPWPPTGSRR